MALPSTRVAMLLCAPLLATASLVSSVSSALNSHGDSSVVTMSLCGAGRSSPTAVGEALGLGASSLCTVVPAATPLALLDVPVGESADGTSAAAVADVLALEVRYADLVERSVHGLGQLQQLLQRSVRLRDLRPRPKLLLLTVTDYDDSAVSEADLTAFVTAQIEELVAGLALPDGPALTSADLLQLHCFFLPSKAYSPDAYERGLATLRDALTADASAGYLLGDSSRTQPASNVVQNVEQAAERAPAAPQSASPAEVRAAYQCGQLAESAARDFQKGASALRKVADGTLVSVLSSPSLRTLLPRPSTAFPCLPLPSTAFHCLPLPLHLRASLPSRAHTPRSHTCAVRAGSSPILVSKPRLW